MGVNGSRWGGWVGGIGIVWEWMGVGDRFLKNVNGVNADGADSMFF